MASPLNRVTSEILDRTPPHDPEAERWVIGSCLLDPRSIDRLAGWLKAEAFYVDANRPIYAALVALRDARQGIDPGLLVHRLRASGELEQAGGVAYLNEVAGCVPHAGHAEHYGRIVLEHYKLRQVIHASTAMLTAAYRQEGTAEELVGTCEDRLRQVKTGTYDQEAGEWQDAIAGALDRAQAVIDRQASVGLLTGTVQFDTDIGGLFPGELFVLAARPGVGKTSLASQWAQHIAQRQQRVYFASLEMSRVELATRCLCSEADVSSKRIRTGTLTTDDIRELAGTSNVLATANMRIDDRAGMTVADIRRGVRHSGDVRMVVVDYLQRVTPPDRKVNRYVQVAEVASGLKTIAREFDVAVLCLSSSSRELDDEGDPKLRHLRESGDIEHEADVVGFLIRPAKWPGDEKACDEHGALVIKKNRNGELGTFRLDWEGHRTRFLDPSNREPAFDRFGG